MATPDLPNLPGTHTWMAGGPVFGRAGQAPVYASDDAEVWVWDADTGERVTDLLDEFGSPVTAPAVRNGWVAGVGVPVAVKVASFSAGQHGLRQLMVPVQSFKDAAAAVAPADEAVAALLGNAASDTRGVLDPLIDDQVGDLVGSTGTASRAAVDARVAAGLDGVLDDAVAAVEAGADQAAGKARSSPVAGLEVGATRILPGVDGQYSAFPSITRTADGRMVMVWRQGSDHLTARDGVVKASFSSDLGKTWTAATTIVSEGDDLRDPVVRLIGASLYLTYSRVTSAGNYNGAMLRISSDNGATWGSAIRVDGGQERAAITAPVVDLGNGELLAAWNGKALATDTRYSAWVAKSTDGGVSWGAPTKVVDGVAGGFDAYEPWVSRNGSTLVLTHRINEYQDLGRAVSADLGGTWGASATMLAGATGRPATTFLADGTLVLAHRNKVSNGFDSGLVRFSLDSGATWSPAKVLESAEPNFWVYSDALELYPGLLLVATATEVSSTSARLSLRYVTRGSSQTPFGDLLGNRVAAILDDRRNLAVADDFDRPDSATIGYAATGHLWRVDNGTLVLSSGNIYQPTGGSGLHYATVDPRCAHVQVEADMMWQTNAGHGIVFRYADANNHWFFTVETNGTNLRLYERVGGTATQRATIGANVPAGFYNRYRVSDVGGVIRCFIDGTQVLTYEASSPSIQRVGVQTNSTSSAQHRCRRFVVHRMDRPT